MTLEVEVLGTSWEPIIVDWLCSRNLKAATGGSCCVKKVVLWCVFAWEFEVLEFEPRGQSQSDLAKLLGILLEIYLFSSRILKCSFKVYHGHKKRKDGSLLVSYDYDGTCVLSGKITAFFFILSKSTERYWHCPGKLRFSVR